MFTQRLLLFTYQQAAFIDGSLTLWRLFFYQVLHRLLFSASEAYKCSAFQPPVSFSLPHPVYRSLLPRLIAIWPPSQSANCLPLVGQKQNFKTAVMMWQERSTKKLISFQFHCPFFASELLYSKERGQVWTSENMYWWLHDPNLNYVSFINERGEIISYISPINYFLKCRSFIANV